MEDNKLNIVIAGHVDHGKSTLIGRLFYDTGSIPEETMEELRRTSKNLGREIEFAFLLDHLEEERNQGITIDTSRAYFKTDKRQYVIIDAPGHTEFIKNMVTGASHAEAAILIVDAAEGVREQTRRHAYILNMLGISQLVVVVNKMDMVQYDKKVFGELVGAVETVLQQMGLSPSQIIPVSAKHGDNIASKSKNTGWYNGPTVLTALDSLNNITKSVSTKSLRFPVQDVYRLNDKRVMVGRIESGSLSSGDEVIFLPSGKSAEVSSIEVFQKEITTAEAGENIGITINKKLFIERGEVICHPGVMPKVTDEFTANIFWLSQQPFVMGNSLVIRCATQEQKCTIKSIVNKIDSSTCETVAENATEIHHTEVGSVVIKTEKPIVLDNINEVPELGRFTLMVNQDISAGGIITGIGDD